MATIPKGAVSSTSYSSSPSGSAGATYKNASGQLINSAGNVVGGAVTSKGLSYNGSDIISGSTVKATDAPKNFTGELGSGVITPSDLTPTSSIVLPTAPTIPNYSGLTTAALTGVGIGSDGKITIPSVSTDTITPTLDNLFATELNLRSQNTPVNQEKIYEKAKSSSNIDQYRSDVNNYTSQLNAIQAKATADQLSLQGQGRGVPEAIIGGQQAQIAKEAAIAALPISAQLAAAQGNLKLAQDNLDTLFKLQVADATAKFDYKNKIIDSVMSYATKSEQRVFEQAKADNERKYQEQKDAREQNTIFAKAIIATQPELASSFMKLDPASSTYQRDFASLVAKVSPDKKRALEEQKLQAEVDALGGGIDVTKLTPEAQGLLSSVSNLRFSSVDEAKRITGNIRNALYKGDYDGAKKQLEIFGYQKLGISKQADFDLYDNAKASAQSALNQMIDQSIVAGPYAALVNEIAPFATISRDKKYNDLKSIIELGQAQLRKGFYGTAVTGSEVKNAKSFLINNSDDIDTIRWKLKNTSDFLAYVNDATIAKEIGMDKPNIDDYLTYRVKDKATGLTGYIPRSEYDASVYEILNK